MTAIVPGSTPVPFRGSDEEHIVGILLTVITAFTTRDAEVVRPVYAPDADWIDTDGTALHGRDAIVEHLHRKFAKPDLSGVLAGPPELVLRWVDDDTVIASTYVERRSQRTLDGKILPPRRSRSLKVLTRGDQGGWHITSDISADARDPPGTGA